MSASEWAGDEEGLALALSKLWPEYGSMLCVPSTQRVDDFMQAAGSAERMTIEWKTDRDGTFRLYKLGRHGDRSEEPSFPLAYMGGRIQMRVFEDEAFAHDEAAKIFIYYIEHDCPPPEYSLRDLNISFGPNGVIQ